MKTYRLLSSMVANIGRVPCSQYRRPVGADKVFARLKAKAILAAAVISCATPSSFAVSVTGDYSDASISGGIFQNAAGQFFSTPGAGLTDVTALFKADAQAAFGYFHNAISLDWSHAVTFKLADLSGIGADGTSLITTFDANGRSTGSEITIDTSAVSHFYLDPTPADNSEWNFANKDAALGGGTVNVGRLGKAVAGGPADGRTDILTLILHETEHSLGISDNSQRFVDVVGQSKADNSFPDRLMTVPKSLTGLPSDYVIPFRAASGHIDSAADAGLFADAVVSEPGFGEGDRALLSDAEIHALCVVNGCSATQFTLNPTIAVPEPSSWLMLVTAGGLIGSIHRRRVFPPAKVEKTHL